MYFMGPGKFNDSAPLRTALALVLLGALLCPGLPAKQVRAQSKAYHEDHVKAAFIFNLTKFVTWPHQPSRATAEPFTIYVVGEQSIQDILKRIVENESINGRPIVVKWNEVYDSADACQILFLDANYRQQWPRIYNDVRDRHILTVADFDTFCELGGIIHAGRRDQRLIISLNIKAAKRAGLRVDSKLLRMASIVEE